MKNKKSKLRKVIKIEYFILAIIVTIFIIISFFNPLSSRIKETIFKTLPPSLGIIFTLFFMIMQIKINKQDQEVRELVSSLRGTLIREGLAQIDTSYKSEKALLKEIDQKTKEKRLHTSEKLKKATVIGDEIKEKRLIQKNIKEEMVNGLTVVISLITLSLVLLLFVEIQIDLFSKTNDFINILAYVFISISLWPFLALIRIIRR